MVCKYCSFTLLIRNKIMKDNDLDAFEKWLEIEFGEEVDKSKAWLYEKSIFRFACEYKHKEIEDLYKHLKHEHDLYRKHLKVYEDEILEYKEAARSEAEEVNRLQAENKKLREALNVSKDSLKDLRDIHITSYAAKLKIGHTLEALKEIKE